MDPQMMANTIQPRAAPATTSVPQPGSSAAGVRTTRSQGEGGGMAPKPCVVGRGGTGGGHAGGAGS